MTAAGGGQHHGTSVCFLCCNVSCLNYELRRKQKPEIDKTSKKGRRCNSVENEVPLIKMASFREPNYAVQIFAVIGNNNESCITARMNLRSVTKQLPA